MSAVPTRFTKLALLVLIALAAAACSSVAEDDMAETSRSTTEIAPTAETTSAKNDETSAPQIEPGPCEFDPPADVSIECGWISVPQHWDEPSDPDRIRLHVATFTSDATPADATPVVYLEGGPGGDALGSINLVFDRFASILDERPLVMFTQRGSALSEVDLECEEVLDLVVRSIEFHLDAEALLVQELETMEACGERLIAEGADLSAYHSVASANDVDAIRSALGYDTWNVLGISYGTRLGQELVRTHPNGVESLILDSVQPTDPRFGSLAALPVTFEGSLDELFAGCEANAECNRANPNLESRLRALVDQADATPFELVAIDPITGESYDAIIDGNRLLGMVFEALYSPETFAVIPEMIGELEAGTTATLASLVGLQIANAPFISHGMYASVMCHDFLAELTPDEAWEEGLTGDELFDEAFAGWSLVDEALCDVFPTGSADASITEPVETDVPTLILAGTYDPITPPSFAEAIEPGFSNSQYAVLPHVGHGVVTDECGMEIALAFMADPTSEADVSCIETSTEPQWIPASLEGIGFEPFEEPRQGFSGVIPAGWDDQGSGISIRTKTNLAHQAVLIQQAGPIPAALFLGQLGGQLGGVAESAGTIDVADRSWEIYNLDGDAGTARVFVHDDEGFTFLVVLIAPSDDLDDIEQHIIESVLESLQKG